MDSYIETLASYVPELILQRLATNPDPITTPVSEHFPAALLFADISGFTALTERLAEQGPIGAEVLTRELNAYFGRLIDLITAHGGDVVKFAGDALTAIWKAEGKGLKDEQDSALILQHSILQAATCALAIQKTLQGFQTSDGHKLAVRLCLGAGDLAIVHLGGIYGRWEHLMVGPPLNQVGQAGAQAEAGQVVLSPEAWDQVQADCTVQLLQNGYVRLIAITRDLQGFEENLPAPLVSRNSSLFLAPELEPALRAYIPGAILVRLAVGQSAWLAELRWVTILFVNLPDLTYTTPLEQGQMAMQAMQTTLYRYEGSINKISIDDKGATLVAALGLPPLAHEDDGARGVQAALALQAVLRELGWHCAIGVTTGRVFCGSVGNSTRREYTMMGDMVNLAARLMQAAGVTVDHQPPAYDKKQATFLLCDEATYQSARNQIGFEALPPIKVKGKNQLIDIYRPTSIHFQSKIENSKAKMDIIGRTTERTILADKLQQLQDGHSGIVIIEGEAGIGKSRLVEDLLQKAQNLNVVSLIGTGEAIEKSTPYHIWRSIFRQLFDLEKGTDTTDSSLSPALGRLAEPQRTHILDKLEQADPAFPHLAPLLNVVLPLDLPDNDLTRQMTGEVRADNTQTLFIGLLKAAAEACPLLLILEDAHWLDSASWMLVRQVSRSIQPLLLVIVTRPMVEPLSPEYHQLRQLPQAQHLSLAALSLRETLRLVCQCLGVAELPQPIATLILEKSEGHPFFSEELAYALRDAGLIKITKGECHLIATIEELQALNFPNSLQAVIISRIDRLTPQQQLALKVASVIGRIFAFRVLYEIHPIEADKTHLPSYLDTLEQLNLTLLETPEPELTYIFKHIITQEVTYNLMAFAQRRELHKAIAEWLEFTYADDLSPFYPLLVYHWNRANTVSKVIKYLEKAGEQALRTGAYGEAVDFLNQVILLAKEQTNQPHETITQQQLAYWQRLLGEAYYGLGQLGNSRQWFLKALACLDRPMPASTIALAIDLARQVLRQIWPLKLSKPPAKVAANLEAARVYGRLILMYYFSNEAIPGLYSAFQGFNLIEKSASSPEVARFYAVMYGVCQFFRLHGLAKIYRRRALEIIQGLNDLPTHAWVLATIGAWSLGFDKWAEVQQMIEQAIAFSKRLGDRRSSGDYLDGLGFVFYIRAQFATAIDTFVELYKLGANSDNPEHQARSLTGQGMSLLRLGQTSQALIHLEMALPLYTVIGQPLICKITNQSTTAVVRLRQGQIQAARQAVEIANQLIGQSLPISFGLFVAYADVAEVYLALWEIALLGGDQAEAKSLKSAARKACNALHRFAWRYPVGQTRAWLYQGLYDRLANLPRKADRSWRKSLDHAQRLDMPYEESLVHYEIGRSLLLDDPKRKEHLTQAAEIFGRLGAAYDLERTRALL